MSQPRYRYGNTAENNGWVFPKGFLTQDVEAGALRIHDDVTPGGYVVPGSPAEFPTGPGPTVLQAGDITAGFYGEVTTTALIDGEALASEIGLTEGRVQNTDSPWLKFASQGKTLFVAKQSYRYWISWDAIAAVDAVYGNTEITIDGCIFKVRLLTGGDADPASEAGGEWNALMYPVHVDDPNAQNWGVNYTDAELYTTGVDNGYRSWCQETSADDASRRVDRGHFSVTSFGTTPSSTDASYFGWRPVLELVSPVESS